MINRRAPRLLQGVVAAVWLSLVLPQVADAQIAVPRTTYDRPLLQVGADLILTQPKGQLAQYIDNGWGGNLYGALRVEREGLLHVRLDGGSARYGTDTRTFNYGFRTFELRTTNNIDWFSLGPEVVIPGGPIRPYASAAFSLTRFRTTSTIRDRNTFEEYDSVDNASDFTTGWVFGGGVYVPFGRRSQFALNLGARYHLGGEATFVREEDVRNAPIDASQFPASRSKADFVQWQLGINYRIPQLTPGTNR